VNDSEKCDYDHDLRIDPEPFEAIRDGRKRFEIRFEDRVRSFHVGDRVLLREYTFDTYDGEMTGFGRLVTGRYTDRLLLAVITYLIRGPRYGLPLNMAILSIDKVEEVCGAESL
jgi:hypothetical protein